MAQLLLKEYQDLNYKYIKSASLYIPPIFIKGGLAKPLRTDMEYVQYIYKSVSS